MHLSAGWFIFFFRSLQPVLGAEVRVRLRALAWRVYSPWGAVDRCGMVHSGVVVSQWGHFSATRPKKGACSSSGEGREGS